MYKICKKCVMDTSDPLIHFDVNDICNHCNSYEENRSKKICLPERRIKLIEKIKEDNKKKKYDCIIGVSGGVDSSYVAYLAKDYGLRALLVHLDNGWNSELATRNIENIVKYTGYDLHTLVINWDEFKDIQQSFFKANVVDLELVSDHAIFATMYKLALKFKTKYILSGENFATEAIMSPNWNWRKSDSKNIKSIHAKFGVMKIKTYPFLGTTRKLWLQFTKRIISIPILDYITYNKESAMEKITECMNWQYYGGKHFESTFTRFYQGYILVKKFNIDKRRAHLSTLINSRQITREEAIQKLKEDVYSKKIQEEDKKLLCKKLSFSEEYFEKYINNGRIEHDFYGSDQKINQFLLNINRLIKKVIY